MSASHHVSTRAGRDSARANSCSPVSSPTSTAAGPGCSTSAMLGRHNRVTLSRGAFEQRSQAMSDDDQAGVGLEVLEAQISLLRASHPDIVVTDAEGMGPRRSGEPFGHLHREGRLLLRGDISDDVGAFLRDRGHDVRPSRRAATRPAGTTVPYHLDGAEPGRGVQEVVASVHDEFGTDVDGHAAATPHHVFFLAPYGWLCPATEPQVPVAGVPADPAEGDLSLGQGVDVAVLDTGLLAGADAHAPWLAGITQFDEDPPDLFD